VSDSVVIHNNGIGIIITNATTTIACGDSINLSTTTSGIQTGPLVYAWSNGAALSHTYVSQPGNYTVTVTNSKSCSASATANVTYNNGVINTVAFTPPVGNLCEGRSYTFINHSTDTSSGWTSTWNMGDGTQV